VEPLHSATLVELRTPLYSGHFDLLYAMDAYMRHTTFSLWCHWPRAVTIESSLESGCGLSHESAQDGCKVLV